MKQVLVFIPLCLLSACSATNTASNPVRSGFVQTQDAAADALGFARERPGQIQIDDGDETVPTPYGGDGHRRTCSTVARDIARLTAVLGPDREKERSVEEQEAQSRGLVERSQDFASNAPDMAGDLASDTYHSTIVGLNPARPIIRFIGRAGEIEAEAREERELALKRRAYLRGMFDGFGCDHSIMMNSFIEYGLTQDPNADAET